MGLAELETVRLLLRGGSIIDWKRLDFTEPREVDHFLGLNLFDLDDLRDERRLRAILAQAVEYLRTAFGYRVAEPVAQPEDLRDLFLLASGAREPRKYRRIACVVLKVMHVIHHLEARELLFRTPIREVDLADRVHRRVMSEAERMRTAGLPVVVVSSSDRPEDIQRCYALGANSYLLKRFDPRGPGTYLAEAARYWIEMNQVTPEPETLPW